MLARLSITSLLALCLSLALAGEANARPRPSSGVHGDFQANKTFGLGLMLGEPTGLSGKYYLGVDTALDFGIGAYYGYYHHDGLHLHADFLWHPVVLAETDPFWLPLYFGVGGRILFAHHYDGRNRYYDDRALFGVRAPIGILMDFNRVPLDIFFELALTFDFVPGPYDYVGLSGAIGARYYF